MKKVIALVSCSASKKNTRREIEAKDLYQGQLFQKTRRLCELRGVDWFILSAMHGLLSPEDRISNYDRTLRGLTNEEREDWASAIVHQLLERYQPSKVECFEIYAGADYYDHLRPNLLMRGFEVQLPLYALGGIGGQLHKLKVEIERLATPAPKRKGEQGNLL